MTLIVGIVCGVILALIVSSIKRRIYLRKYLHSKNLLFRNVALGLKDKGDIEVLANMYFEFYLLKKQLMEKGLIDAEANYLLGEVYEFFAEYDKKKHG